MYNSCVSFMKTTYENYPTQTHFDLWNMTDQTTVWSDFRRNTSFQAVHDLYTVIHFQYCYSYYSPPEHFALF